MRMKEAEWDAVIDTNLKSVFRLSKAVLRGMNESAFGPHQSTSLPWSVRAESRSINYAASKAASRHDAVARAGDRQPRNTVNCVAPGFYRHGHDPNAHGGTA